MTKVVATALLLLGAAAEGRAKLLLTQEEALRLAFPAPAAARKETAYLSREERERAQALARSKIESRVWTRYVGQEKGAVVGYAYFDSFIIRTMPATLMAALDAKGRLRFIEVLSFNEPEDYLPSRRWLELFGGRALDPDLRVKGGIRNVSGATLSAHAVTESARRILAVHQVLQAAAAEPGTAKP